MLGEAKRGRGTSQVTLDLAPAGERPIRHDDRLTVGVVDRVLGEPSLAQRDEGSVAQRVPYAGRDLVHALLGRSRPSGRDGDDRRGDQVNRDHVDDALGYAGELPQQAPRVGDDHRLGHPEAADPSRNRVGERGLHDRGADDRYGQVSLRFREHDLAERLREGVGVGPTERLGAGPTELDEMVGHPVLTQSLRPLGEKRRSRGAELASRRLAELRELARSPTLRRGRPMRARRADSTSARQSGSAM